MKGKYLCSNSSNCVPVHVSLVYINYISIKLLIYFEGSWWARGMMQELSALIELAEGKSSVLKIHIGCVTTMGNSHYHRGSNVLSYAPLQAHAHSHACTCALTLTAYIHTDTCILINKNKNLNLFLKKQWKLGMSLILNCFTLACSCMKPPVRQPVRDTGV